jgi:hypothetical protein
MKEESIEKLKQSMVSTFRKYGDEKAIQTKGVRYTGNEVAEEIENETELGLGMIESIINLTINLIKRDKINA